MTNSLIRIIGVLAAVVATTAAMCNKDAAATPAGTTATTASAPATPAPGLPADFPMAPGLSACKPIVQGPEVICEWHNVNGHAIYTFYHDALPKAGYTLLPGAQEVLTPHYLGAIGFKKGNVQGAVSIPGTDLTIQVITGQ